MSTHDCSRHPRPGPCSDNLRRRWLDGLIAHWPRIAVLVGGCAALGWLLLRTGSKPSRYSYPCQQAAVSAASLAFGATLVTALLALRRGIARRPRQACAAALAFVGIAAVAATWNTAQDASVDGLAVMAPRDGYRARVFHVSACPQDPIGQRFGGLDDLLATMGREGLKLYQSPRESLLAGPAGIVAADDVVVIKINYQWGQRGGTNVDLLRGLIHRLVAHPDGFTGEVVVCENTQFVAPTDFDRAENNAQTISLSPRDVVTAFQSAGAPVSHFDWTTVRSTSVAEYSAGNMQNGYVLYPYDARWSGRLSYPKFRSVDGTYVSMRYGIWTPASAMYDRARLKVINMPVLKHHSTYGLTGCVKHYMGLVTGALSTNAHNAIAVGALGAVMGELQPPDLNILDCIWVGGNPWLGPSFGYDQATRRDELVASVDPVAADLWAAKHVLIPTFLANGFSPPWPAPSADPDDPASAFRQYLDPSMGYLLAAGYDATNDPANIDAFSGSAAADRDADGDVDLRECAALQVCVDSRSALPAGCAWLDFDASGAIEAGDVAIFLESLTGPGELP